MRKELEAVKVTAEGWEFTYKNTVSSLSEWLYDKNRRDIPIFLQIKPSTFHDTMQIVCICMEVDLGKTYIMEAVHVDPAKEPFDPSPFEQAVDQLFKRVDVMDDTPLGFVFKEVRL